MKMLTGLLLVCAMMALTNAAAVPAAEPDGGLRRLSIQHDDNYIVQSATFCPIGWTSYNNRCFLYVSTPMSWARAEKNCQAQGGNLASVHSNDEHHFIQGMLLKQTQTYPPTWLGGSDAEEEGFWMWSDGSQFTYYNWCQGEPNNTGGQNCLLINLDDKQCWDDLQCFEQRPFVCAKEMESFLG